MTALVLATFLGIDDTYVVLIAGAFVGLGIVMAADGWTTPPRPRQASTRDPLLLGKALAAVALGALGGLATRWPVGAVAAAAGGWVAVGLVASSRRSNERALERTEAIAAWAEQLRDTFQSGHGIQEVIRATSKVAPLPVRGAVERLAERTFHQPLPEALTTFGNDLDDQIGDLVAAVLATAVERGGRDLPLLLTELASVARERVAMRRRVEARRASVRQQARLLVIIVIGAMVAFTIGARQFLEPIGTPIGQLVLAIVVLMIAVGLTMMMNLSRWRTPPRLRSTDPAAAGARAARIAMEAR